jgi:signal peptidase I
MPRGFILPFAAGIVATCALGLAWFFLAPQGVGGGTAYSVVEGASMTPLLARGDLAILRRRHEYRVGAVVAYRSEQLRSVVLHRIVATGSRYSFKGDANQFVDPQRVTGDRLVGELWFSIPLAGSVLAAAGAQRNTLLGAAGLALLLGAGLGRRRGRGPRGADPPPIRVFRLMGPIVGGVAGLGLVLASLAFTRPPTREVTVPHAYTHLGTFAYSAHAPRGSAYPDGKVVSGDRVFLRLVDRLSFEFNYRLASKFRHQVTAAGTLSAELDDGNGWTRRLDFGSSFIPKGDAATARATINLKRLRERIAVLEGETGIHQETFQLTLTPRVDVRGSVGEHRISELFAPRLTFRVDAHSLTLDPISRGTAHDLIRTEAETLPQTTPNLLEFGPIRLDVRSARRASVAAAVLAAAASVAAVALWSSLRRRGQDALIAARYGPLILRVASVDCRLDAVWVEVETIDALARLAQRQGRVILHESAGEADAYLVIAGSTIYRHRSPAGQTRVVGSRRQPASA